MEELFGLSMNVLMYVLLGIFVVAMAAVAGMAIRHPVMLKLGLRNIPRRRGQTILIVIGIMLSTVIMSAAFGTGDTLSHSIRNEAITGLRHVDEIILPIRVGEDAGFGAFYFPYDRFTSLSDQLSGNKDIDGLTPQIGESVPVRVGRTALGEGRMRVVGLDPALLDGFGAFELVTGGAAGLEELGGGEVFITEEAVETLEARVGDELEVFLEGRTIALTVRGVIKRGGLAGVDPTMLLPLARVQEMFDKPGEINSIVISNTGDERGGAERSEDVTRQIRVLFNDLEVAAKLRQLLGGEAIIEALEAKLGDEGLGESLKEDLEEFLAELSRDGVSDELNSLLADQDLTALIMDGLDADTLQAEAREAGTLFLELAEFRVIEVKRQLLNTADEVGTAVTSIFVLFSSFSITVGILLIFLIFSMLAAARKYEMGMARAVGAKRRHLVLMFAFEGTAYAVVSAAVGVFLGLVVSVVMVLTLNQIFGDLDDAFRLTIHFEPRSIVVAYCLGMVITFATVAASAYRVSRLNIVVAIRGLPETSIPTQAPALTKRLVGLLKAVVLPFYFLALSVRSLLRRRFARAARSAVVAPAVVFIFPIWLVAIILATLRLIQPYLVQGWLTFIAGAAITYFAVTAWERISYFGGGVSLMLLGLGLALRWQLRRTTLRDDLADRIVATVAGGALLVFWTLPFRAYEALVGDLQGDFDVMFVSGIAMVAAAVWVIMYNADLLLRGVSFLTGWMGSLRPVVVIAVAYPMAARFRTGLTLAMFALVIFTLTVMSVLTETFSTQFEEPRKVFGGFDIGGAVNLNTPIVDIRQAIAEDPQLRVQDFEAIGGFTWVSVSLRAIEGQDDRWHGRSGMVADDEFLSLSRFEFKIVAEGYGPSSEDVMRALKDEPGLAVIGGGMLDTDEPTAEDQKDRLFGGLYYGSERMDPVRVDVREPQSGLIIPLTVIAVVDRLHRNSSSIIASRGTLDEALPFPLPLTRYRFRVAEGVDAKTVAGDLAASFLGHGMETEVFKEVLDEETAAGKAFFRLFTGFMALGLLVGVAALGVISTRAVVERRQQIGVLRAIGFKRGMVQTSMLLESSFVSLLGAIIGLVLGMVLSYHAVTDIRQDEGVESIRFAVPWLQVGLILAVTYLFSLLATFLPARQAARIYPAEALRYE